MEGKRCSSSAASSSLASQLLGGKSSSSSSSGLFSSVFPPPSTVGGKATTWSRSHDIFGPYNNNRKQQLQDYPSTGGSASADHMFPPRGNESKALSWNKDGSSFLHHHQGEKIDPCTLSSSLYYGGQDICNNPPDSHYSANSSYNHSYSKDGDGNLGGSTIDSRGDWWQGSLYY